MGFVSVQEKAEISLTKSYLEKLWLIEISLATLPALTALRPVFCLGITSLHYSPKHSIVNCRAHTFSWLASFLLFHDSLLVNESLRFPSKADSQLHKNPQACPLAELSPLMRAPATGETVAELQVVAAIRIVSS